MEAVKELYCNSLERHVYPAFSHTGRQKLGSRFISMPKSPHGTQPSYQHAETTTTLMRPAGQGPFDTARHAVMGYATVSPQSPQQDDRAGQSSGLPARCENLKRRPSLREAARSFRSSKVTKRLRRHIKADDGASDEDDQGTSESRRSGTSTDPTYKLRTGSADQDELMQSQRRPSTASDMMSGFQSSLSIRTHGRERGSSSASSQMVDSSDAASIDTSLTTVSSTSQPSRRTEDNDTRDDDDDNVSERGGQPSAHNHSLEPDQPQLFACPFAKHDSQRYSGANLDELNYRGCSQSYLKDLARVKQHLYRVHERPQYHCETCFEVFKNQGQCVKHVTSQSCIPRPCPFNEKMTPEQLLAIKKKNRGTNPYKGWYEIYKTLFPGSQLPMSPYATFVPTVDTLESFMDFVVREVPARLQQELGGQDTVVARAIRGSLPDILRDIRRDFIPSSSRKQETKTQDVSERESPGVTPGETTDNMNFHRLATIETTAPDQSLTVRPLTMDLPQQETFPFQPITATQPRTQSVSSDRTFHEHGMGLVIDAQYSQQHMNYVTEDREMMPVDPEPVTAIWQPDECEIQQDYFVDSHQTQHPAPGYLLHLEHGHSGIPIMTTAEIGSFSLDHGVTDTMNWFYTGVFGGHNS